MVGGIAERGKGGYGTMEQKESVTGSRTGGEGTKDGGIGELGQVLRTTDSRTGEGND